MGQPVRTGRCRTAKPAYHHALPGRGGSPVVTQFEILPADANSRSLAALGMTALFGKAISNCVTTGSPARSLRRGAAPIMLATAGIRAKAHRQECLCYWHPNDKKGRATGDRGQGVKTTEENLIERIRRRIPSAEGGALRLGIGDDAAVLRAPAGADWVVTCDPFLEDVHFLADAHPPAVVGYKALARATSDIAAMGARPEVFLLGLTLPTSRTGSWLDDMLSGMARAARAFRLRIAGGDVARSPAKNPKIALNITVLGTAWPGHILRRSAARPGDAIFVSGRLGAAQLGLELILRGMHRHARWRYLLAPQFRPVPQLELGRWLAGRGIAAAMDISDGLSSDLHRLCEASGVGARIEAEKLPCTRVPGGLRSLRLDPLTLALHGGEDYGLLFTVPERNLRQMRKPPIGKSARHGGQAFPGLTRIGEIVRGRGVTLIAANGKSEPLEPRGWDHFRA